MLGVSVHNRLRRQCLRGDGPAACGYYEEPARRLPRQGVDVVVPVRVRPASLAHWPRRQGARTILIERKAIPAERSRGRHCASQLFQPVKAFRRAKTQVVKGIPRTSLNDC